MNMLNLRRVHMENIVNFRSLGGYAAKDLITKHGVFYRCGWMKKASDSDMEKVKSLGIKTVIDLRSKLELEKVANNLSDCEHINYIHVDLLKRLDPDEMKTLSEEDSEKYSLINLYKYLLDNEKDSINTLISQISASVSNGGVLFHCSAGKDRTGLTAMLLLSIAGVNTLDIIADYEVSATYIQTHGESALMGSDPRNMIQTLSYIKDKYTSPVEYLKSIGIDDTQLQIIRDSFLDM